MPALGLGVLGSEPARSDPRVAGQDRILEARGKPFELSLGFLSHDTCPFLILHDQVDMIIPWQQSQLLINTLSTNGSHVEFRLLGQAGHGARSSTRPNRARPS